MNFEINLNFANQQQPQVQPMVQQPVVQDNSVFNNFMNNYDSNQQMDRIALANQILDEYGSEAFLSMELNEYFVEMDEDGTILSQLVDSDGDGKIDRVEYYDNEAGHAYDTNADGVIDETLEFSEDENGNLIKQNFAIDEEGNKELKSETTIDENGNKVTTEYDKDGKAKSVEKYEYVYDDEGNVIKEILKTDTNGDGVFDKTETNTDTATFKKAVA